VADPAVTVALNVYLYIRVPKVFPQQDTGLMIGNIQADQPLLPGDCAGSCSIRRRGAARSGRETPWFDSRRRRAQTAANMFISLKPPCAASDHRVLRECPLAALPRQSATGANSSARCAERFATQTAPDHNIRGDLTLRTRLQRDELLPLLRAPPPVIRTTVSRRIVQHHVDEMLQAFPRIAGRRWPLIGLDVPISGPFLLRE